MKKSKVDSAPFLMDIFDPARMDERARSGDSTDTPRFMANELSTLHLSEYRNTEDLLRVASEILALSDGNWNCESPTKRTMELIAEARIELRRARVSVEGAVARLDKMTEFPKICEA